MSLTYKSLLLKLFYSDAVCTCPSASIGEAQAEDTDTSSEGYTAGQFVLIKYEGKLYVGQIVDISMEGLQVNCMKQHGDKNGFVWPNRRDCIYYQDHEVDVAYHDLSKAVGLLLSPSLTGLCTMKSEFIDLFQLPCMFTVDIKMCLFYLPVLN